MKKPTTEEEWEKLVLHTTGYILLLDCVVKYGQDYLEGTKVYSMKIKQLINNLKSEISSKSLEWVDIMTRNKEGKYDSDEHMLLIQTLESFYAKIDQILGNKELLKDFIEGEIVVTEITENNEQTKTEV